MANPFEDAMKQCERQELPRSDKFDKMYAALEEQSHIVNRLVASCIHKHNDSPYISVSIGGAVFQTFNPNPKSGYNVCPSCAGKAAMAMHDLATMLEDVKKFCEGA